jgi:Holliday junction resolvase RusA-like endonuclease
VPELHLVVVSEPVAKARPRVAVRNGRAHAYTPTKTANAEWRIRAAFLERFPGHRPLTGPLELSVVARIKMPASMPKKQRDTALPVTRPDCDNYLKTVLDALNGVAFVDDSQVVSVCLDKRYAGGLPPSWEIHITELVLAMAQPAATPQEPAHAETAGLR